MSSLYEITGDILELQEMLESGEYDEQMIDDTMEGVLYDFEQKADEYGKVIRNMEANASAIKDEIDRLTIKRNSIKNGIERLKMNLKACMEVTGQKKITGDLFTFSVRNNAMQLPKELDIKDVPNGYIIPQEPKIDRKALLAAVKAGKVEGIELTRTTSLTMK